MSRAEATLTKVADLVRGGESYAKYEEMYRRDLTEIPSFRLLASRVQGKVVDRAAESATCPDCSRTTWGSTKRPPLSVRHGPTGCNVSSEGP